MVVIHSCTELCTSFKIEPMHVLSLADRRLLKKCLIDSLSDDKAITAAIQKANEHPKVLELVKSVCKKGIAIFVKYFYFLLVLATVRQKLPN